MQCKLSNILVEERFRKDFGNLDELMESIKENGLITPIAVRDLGNGKYLLLAGERRYRACKALGMEEIPVRVYEGEMSDLLMRQIELEENIQRKDMTWLEECALKREIHHMRQLMHGKKTSTAPDAPGWSLRDTAKLLNESHSNVSLDISLAETVEQFPEIDWTSFKNKNEARRQLKRLTKTVIRQSAAEEFKKRYKKSRLAVEAENSYILGDCLEMLKKLPDGFADFIEIDPPYGIDLMDNRDWKQGKPVLNSYKEIPQESYLDFMKELLAECSRISKPTTWLILWYAPDPWHCSLLELLENAGFIVHKKPCVWVKRNGQTNMPKRYLASAYEPFFYACKSFEAELNKRGCLNVFYQDPVPAQFKKHPTEKPAELMREILEIFSTESSQVVVPFAGSGRTLIEAWKSCRRAIGYDLSEDYRNGYIQTIAEEFPEEEVED